MEVFPVPGGPHRTIEGKRLHLMEDPRSESGPRIWDWPTISSTFLGRIRSARGSEGFETFRRGDGREGEDETGDDLMEDPRSELGRRIWDCPTISSTFLGRGSEGFETFRREDETGDDLRRFGELGFCGSEI